MENDLIEWSIYARILLEYNRNATFWDLFKFVYTDLIGEFPIKETDKQFERAEELFFEGYSFREISQSTGISYMNVISYIDGVIKEI